MNNDFEGDEDTPVPNNVINIKPFVASTNERLSFTEQRLYNIEGSLNHITEIDFPVLNRKLDRILDSLRDMNKPTIKIGLFKRIWAYLWN
jgi:hypothetical protein